MKRVSILLTLGVAICVMADEPAARPIDANWVTERVRAWQPTAAERAFDRIGWAANLADAFELARRHRRPVFLFTYDGESLSGYRC